MSIFEGVTTSVKGKVDGVRNKFGDVAGFVEAHNPLRKKETPPAAPAYEGPLFLTPEAGVENIDVYSARTQATVYERVAQELGVEQERLGNQDFEDDLKDCTDGVTLGRTFVGQAQAEERVHVRAREYDLGMQTDPIFIPIWNENGRVGGLTALQAKIEARVQEADNKLLIHYMARMMGPVQGAIDAERVQEYVAEMTAGNLYPRAPTTDASSVARQFVQEVFYRVKQSQEEASKTQSGEITTDAAESKESETFDKWLPGAIEALPIPVDMRETLCVRVYHELDQLGVAAEYLSGTADRGDHTSIAQMVGERVNEELMGRSNIAEILQTGEELVRIIGQFADIQHKDPAVRAHIAEAFLSRISALREALPQTVPASTQEGYEPDEQRKLLDAIEAQIQIYAAEDTSIETVHETINTIARLVGLNVQEGDNAEDDSIEQESGDAGGETPEEDGPEAILQEYLRDANQIYHEGIVALEELDNQHDPVINLEGVAPTDIVRKLLSRKIDAQGRMHESQSRNPPFDPAGIEETVREIELLRVGYVERAIEVLSRKRTRVVDALNATLGMQSVINELKVKGMKHGVSPDLISISLVSLTSGEINENIIFQMQERSRNIVDEISQCTKEIALSDPSKWEHSVNKYNTVEAWKARFGKAKPIEAAAQATGLHDRAERRSREAREEVRLALGAVAEFGGGPEQVGPEDAMEQLQNSPVLLARIRHVHEDAQKRKGELENQKKELEVMLVYVEKCVERAKELKRALDGYDRRLDALTNENSPIGPLRLRLQELESAQAEDWDLDAMIEVCGRLRDMHHDAGETHDKELMEQRIQIIEGLKAERSRAQSATPPNPSDNTPVAAAGASGQPPEGGGGSPTAEATPRVERTKKSYEHTMAITLPVTKTIEVPFPGLVVDGKQAVIRVELIPNGTEIVWREDKSKEGGGEWVDESRFTPAISVIFDEDDERQKLLLDGLIAKGTQTSANVMTVYSGSQDMYRWGVRRSNGNDGEALVGSELQLQIWCDVDTVRQENIVRTVDGIAQTEGGDELGALTDQMTALWAQSDKENDLSKKLKCYKDALEIAQRINYAEAIKNSKDGILYVESLILGNEISTQVAEIVAGYTEKADLSAFLTQARELTGKISKLYAMEVQNSHENPRWSVSTAVDALIDLYERTVMSGCIGEEKYADVITVAREVQGILNTFEVSEHTERFQARVLAYLADSYEGAKQYSLATSTLREFIDMAKRVYGGKHYNPRSDEERLSQLKALQAEQKSTEGGGGALIEGFANPDTFRIGEPVQLRWDMQTEHSLSCAEDRKVSIIVWRRGDENFQVNLYDERNNDSREGAMTLTEARAVGPFMNLIKKKDGGDITENWDVKVEVGEIGTDRLLPLTLTVTSKTSPESGASTSDLPAYIADEIKTAPWIPEKLKDQVFRLYELSWAATQKELALVAKAEEWARATKIPVVGHAVAGFAEFIQGAFSVRDMQTGKITPESIQRAKDHFAQWFTEGLKGTAELGELFVGGEVGVLKGILTKEGVDLADSSIKRIISGYIMRHLASKLGEASDTEGSGLKAMGNILAELLQNEGNLTQMTEALESSEGFDVFLVRLKEYFSNQQSTA